MIYEGRMLLLAAMAVTLSGCTAGTCCARRSKPSAHPVTVKVVSWNVQTFFDAVRTGSEYKEFYARTSPWNSSAYKARLARLCSAVRSLDADIYVFQEIENAAVLRDMSNMLAEGAWNQRRSWRYACFASEPDAAFGCAVLSRFPLGRCTIHSLDVRTKLFRQPPLRPVLRVTADIRGRELVILANHWKSQSGGGCGSAFWRAWQESVLAGCIIRAGSGAAVIACGDFNRNTEQQGETPAAAGQGCSTVVFTEHPYGNTVQVASPWALCPAEEKARGSYRFRDTWERIDSCYCAGTARITAFTPETGGPWADSHGYPVPYRLRTGTGYSDHLPVCAVVTF